MPLSRLDNFLKNVRGNIIYVNPNDLDATDSVENRGNSMGRPFLTIQRALIEASRFSYQQGLDNDRFGKTTVLLFPGEHYVDNRPGWIPDGTNNYLLRNGSTSSDFAPFSLTTDFDLNSSNNSLYKLNSIYGGVIVPRGVSIVGYDLRKTKIRPLYVPNPTNSNITSSAIFRITGGSYFWQFTNFDADINKGVFKDYTLSKAVPNFSHHKLTVFEYADGVNDVEINDAFISNFSTNRTDLDMYYEKVGLAYGPASGRAIEPDYPSSGLDIQPKIDEYRIVGPTSGEVGISSIRAGDGVISTTTITVTLTSAIKGLDVDTAFNINNVPDAAYNGSFVCNKVTSSNDTGTLVFEYGVPTEPTSALPTPAGSTVVLDTDTVTSSSPYIFNVSLRSVYGMSGLHADGAKATGFKSMVVAQFTGVSLQKDDNAFVRFNETSGTFDDSTTIANIHSDAQARYKPSYYNYHIRASNNAICQLVSIFAIGYARQFECVTGGDFSVTNSNSNFGQYALTSSGFRDDSFAKDDVGYFTNLIPPKQITDSALNFEYSSIDISRTVGVGSTSRLYLQGKTNADIKPPSVIQGYRFGAKVNDKLNLNITQSGVPSNYASRIVMPNTQADAVQVTSVKESTVGRTVGSGNSITANTLTFTSNHQLSNGETIRIVSDNARLPDGLDSNGIYFAITTGLNADQIKVAVSLNDASEGNALSINNLGGTLIVQSRVSDKLAGDIGHPIQYDNDVNQWYVTVGTAATDNSIYPTIVGLGTTALGEATSRTYITRTPDTRSLGDKIYKFRYVIPAGSGITSARPPRDSYVLQESNDVTGANDTEVALQFSPAAVSMTNETELRNFSFVKGATWSSGTATYTTELPHDLSVGSQVKVVKITSTNNTAGVGNSAYNGTFTVSTTPSSNIFTVAGSATDPGTFTNNTSQRTTSLPTYQRVRTSNTYYIYDVESIKEYKTGEQDGIYYLTAINSSNKPAIAPFNDGSFAFSQPLVNLYPQYDKDNPNSNPNSTLSYAKPDPLGKVVVDEVKKSITKESIDKTYADFGIGVGLTDIVSTSAGTSHTVFTNIDHGLNPITKVSIASSGGGYGNGTGSVENLYNANLTGSATGINASARVTVNAAGQLTAVKVMDGGAGYVAGQTLSVVGIATTTGYTAGTVTIDKIYNNVGNTVRVSGVSSVGYADYNQLYTITGISSYKSIQLNSLNAVNNASTTGVGASAVSSAFEFITGSSIGVSTITYNNVTGLATVTTTDNHGLRVDNKVVIGGATTSFYNGEFIVTQNVGLTTFIMNVGISTLSPAVGGTLNAYIPGPTSQAGNISLYDENYGGRQVNIYAGITTNLQSAISNATTPSVSIANVENYNFNIGDYLRIDDEIVRIKTTVTSNPISVFRGLFGTKATTHIAGAVVRRIDVPPIELRRTSIIRASGHTFEYIGFGPGNYSTALPSRQGEQPSLPAQLLSQSLRSDGGVNVYTGMNDRGDFYIGNKRISSNTGKEEVFDTPVPTITGEDILGTGSESGVDVMNPLEATVSRALTVEGGPNNNILSEFNGPVVFSQKVTSTSDEGLESNSLFLQGDATVSRKYTVGISIPTAAGNPGDVVYNSDPKAGGILGWTYTTENGWYAFGNISLQTSSNELIFDKVGIATTTAGESTVRIGSGTSLVAIDGDGVGIGTTANGVKLRVEGTVRGTFVGDGSGLTNLANDSLWTNSSSGLEVYPTSNKKIGIGTTAPDGGYTLELGTAGTGATDLYVANTSKFISTAGFSSSVNISGNLISVDYDLNSSSGKIVAGVVTSTQVQVGTGGTILSTTAGGASVGVGIGTTVPRAALDVEGSTRLKSYHEFVRTVTSSSGVVEIDVSQAQSFQLTTSEDVTAFNVTNKVADSTTAFTLRITQGSTPRTLDLGTVRVGGGSTIPVYWPGGVKPTVTNVASKTDLYSFMTFDGFTTLYGVIGGQNFS